MRPLTHAEACDLLNRAAKALAAEQIDREEWFERVEKILAARAETAMAELRGIAKQAVDRAKQHQPRAASSAPAPPGART